MATAFAFVGSLLHDDGPDVESLRKLCTPESWEAFGDFTAARDAIGERGLATRADPPATGEPNVRYAKMVHMDDPEREAERADGWVSIGDARIITMQWRPADGYWRVHAFGMPVLPEDLPPVS
ncbi:hypothetical protein [Streptomyces sp. NPDC086519]|uniref:hypothetical protein n=1 Tax=Streptomyces sp. NPDC086519 TaxID=3154863 RepID=UPI003415FDF0